MPSSCAKGTESQECDCIEHHRQKAAQLTTIRHARMVRRWVLTQRRQHHKRGALRFVDTIDSAS